ncbi:MAG: hypothetical protein K6T55_07685 [Syntrophobacterales bacterium]|nr:hypothetical protein [Syntrophobacterales bacterium]
MTAVPAPRPLKVCGTCRHWTKEYKGFCRRLQHGVGKFHLCAGWENGAPHAAAEASPIPEEASCMSQPHGEVR